MTGRSGSLNTASRSDPVSDYDWTAQYFEHLSPADRALIPIADGDAWQRFPDNNWVYDKLKIASAQGIGSAPHGVEPPSFPVFSKPLMNLHGMGTGSLALHSYDDYIAHYQPGHFWMELLTGRHVSTDVAVVNGEPKWWRHSEGLAAGEGMFDYWTIHAAANPEIEAAAGAFMRTRLEKFSGMINFESIGARMIEMHLRITDQWPDIYGGKPWVDAVAGLYRHGEWRFEEVRRTGYSVALFGPMEGFYRHPPAEFLARIKGVASIQITFHEDKSNAWHSNPPGGFRLAVINGFDLTACKAARRTLARHFGLDRIINEVA